MNRADNPRIENCPHSDIEIRFQTIELIRKSGVDFKTEKAMSRKIIGYSDNLLKICNLKFRDCKQKDIADMLGITQGAVSQQVKKIKEDLEPILLFAAARKSADKIRWNFNYEPEPEQQQRQADALIFEQPERYAAEAGVQERQTGTFIKNMERWGRPSRSWGVGNTNGNTSGKGKKGEDIAHEALQRHWKNEKLIKKLEEKQRKSQNDKK